MSLEPPKEEAIDKVIKLTKAVIDSTVPGGSLVTEVLLSIIKLPYQQRNEQWQKDLCDALNKIKDMGIDFTALQNNEEFIDILFQVIPMGIKHSQNEKRQALKNVIIHSAQDDLQNFSLKQMFLNYIDTFTIWHIKILALFINPKIWFANNKQPTPGMGMIGSVRGTLEAAYPDLKRQQNLVNSIWTDLYNKELLASDKSLLVTTMTGEGALARRTTELGEIFINFISE